MAAANVPGLEKLHEIVLPDPVSWMPQTAGWYAVLGLIVVLAGWWVYGRFRRFRKNRYRRFALAELGVIERDLQQPEKRARALAEIPVLVKRTALAAFSRSEVAGLSGEEWLAFLDKTVGGKVFTEKEGRLLPELAYAPGPRISKLPDEMIGQLIQLIHLWIRTHKGRDRAPV
jgi:hypothetical protein